MNGTRQGEIMCVYECDGNYGMNERAVDNQGPDGGTSVGDRTIM